MFEEIAQYPEYFYELEKEKQDEKITHILFLADQQPDAFVDWFRKLTGTMKEDIQPLVYEALAKNAGAWSIFFIEEAKAILQEAETAEKPEETLTQLIEFDYIDPAAFEGRKEYVIMLAEWLQHDSPKVQHAILLSLERQVYITDTKVIEQIKALLKSKHWRIRYWTAKALANIGVRGEDTRISFMDGLRARFMNPYLV